MHYFDIETAASTPPVWLEERLSRLERRESRGCALTPCRSQVIWEQVRMDGMALIEGGAVVRAAVLGPDPESYEGVAIVLIERELTERIVVRGKSIQGVDFEEAFEFAIAAYRKANPSAALPVPCVAKTIARPTEGTLPSKAAPVEIVPLGVEPLSDSGVDLRIREAITAGTKLTSADVLSIREAFSRAEALSKRANRVSAVGSDPMNKGHAFPMGVGFTRVTKRAAQRIDASVRRAGIASDLYRRAGQARTTVDRLLSGIGTQADKQRKELAREEMRFQVVNALLNWKRGAAVMQFEVVRVNRDRAGYPSSFTFTGGGVVKGVGDKVDVVRDFFGGDKSAFRALVDSLRSAAVAQPVTTPVQQLG